MKDAQFVLPDGSMSYKIGVHGKIFMLVNGAWILSTTTLDEIKERMEQRTKDRLREDE